MTFDLRYPKRLIPNVKKKIFLTRSSCLSVKCKKIDWAYGKFPRYSKFKLTAMRVDGLTSLASVMISGMKFTFSFRLLFPFTIWRDREFSMMKIRPDTDICFCWTCNQSSWWSLLIVTAPSADLFGTSGEALQSYYSHGSYKKLKGK